MQNKTLFNVYAVVNGAPLAKVNSRRMSRDAAHKKAEALQATGGRAYAVRG